MTTFSVSGSEVLVLGVARSGVAAAELLAKRQARVTLSDVRASIDTDVAHRVRGAGISLELGVHRAETITRADLIVLSPGVSPRLPVLDIARRRCTPIISEIELAARWLQGPIVAVTGTKGKSTTTVLTGRMLDADGQRVLVGGNVGTALSSQVEASSPEIVHVVEVSSFQLELTQTFRPSVAVFLNLSPDHLDRHPSFEAYADAKARIFANQTSADTMVVNADDPQVLALARRGRARQLQFGLTSSIDEGVRLTSDAIAYRTAGHDQTLIPRSAVRVPGRHLLSDVLAAAAAATVFHVSPDAMRQAVETFRGLEHTLEQVLEIDGVRFVNDSKATNVVAARSAIEAFDCRVVVILGGRFKGGDLGELVPPLRSRRGSVVAIGEARPLIRDRLGPTVPVTEAETMAEAVDRAFSAARPDGVVLLAPGCASLDMFTDYAERGRVFKKEVGRLARDGSAG